MSPGDESLLSYRLGTVADVFDVMKVYQKSESHFAGEELFLDYRKLQASLAAADWLWILSESNQEAVAVIAICVDRAQRMGKILHLLADRTHTSGKDILRQLLRYALNYLEHVFCDIDLVYSSTITFTMAAQEITILEGFKIAGIFPNAIGGGHSKLNGVTICYFANCLSQKRFQEISLHPSIVPFFQVTRGQLTLPDLQVTQTPSELEKNNFGKLPILELIQAPKFVEGRFSQLNRSHSEMANFYPFYSANALICDPSQEIEIFIAISQDRSSAAIIGEHIERSIYPVDLYTQVLHILQTHGISYVEIINDAGDSYGIDCFLKAGFTPSAYVPAFKRQGETRRDYVVMVRSFVTLMRPSLAVAQPYVDFFREFYKIERKNYFRKLSD